MEIVFTIAKSNEDYEKGKLLFKSYAQELTIDLDFKISNWNWNLFNTNMVLRKGH